jgi:hypothetical protein
LILLALIFLHFILVKCLIIVAIRWSHVNFIIICTINHFLLVSLSTSYSIIQLSISNLSLVLFRWRIAFTSVTWNRYPTIV